MIDKDSHYKGNKCITEELSTNLSINSFFYRIYNKIKLIKVILTKKEIKASLYKMCYTTPIRIQLMR